MHIQRRRFMKAVLGLGAALPSGLVVTGKTGFAQPAALPANRRRHALLRLGKACLNAHPHLAAAGLKTVPDPVGQCLASRIADDFRDNRTLLVDGWLLAESEAAFYVRACRAA